MSKENSKFKKGYSLIEVLLAIGVFSLLAVLVTQTLANTLRSAKKSDTQSKVRTNFDYAISVMERQLRNADNITTCDGNPSNIIEYTDANGDSADFYCNLANEYVASRSGTRDDHLTSDEVSLTSCSFTCTQESGVPDSIEISLSGTDNTGSGVESSHVTVQTRVMLRTY